MRIGIAAALAAVLTCSSTGAAGEPLDVRFTLDAPALEERGQLRRLKLYPGSGGDACIGLDDMVLVEDDAPGVGMPEGAKDRSWFEYLHRGVAIRKRLILDDPRAFSGWLVFNGLERKDNDTPLEISLNGVRFQRLPTKIAHPRAIQYYTRDWPDAFDSWFFVELPVGALREGVNEIVMRAESEETDWQIMIAADSEYWRGSETRTRHPNRSAKSTDGGATWDDERLGHRGEIDGEYCVRLSLDRYASGGEYISPVIDIAGQPGTVAVKRRVDIGRCSIGWDIDTPEGASAVVQVSWGTSPVPAADGWTAFESVGGLSGEWRNPPGRYLRFRVRMTTGNPLVTPSLRGMTVTTAGGTVGDGSAVFRRLAELDNGSVVRPSVDFTWEDFSALREYREKFKLDEVVAGAATEFEAQLRLMRWAYEIPIGGLNRWAWDYYDLPLLKMDEDGEILLQKDYKGRRRDQHCLYCNLTLVGACLAMGYPARWVNIATRGTFGHEVTEVWSNDFDKWVFLDATRDYYIYDPDTGVPMSLVEINARLADILPRPATWDTPIKWQVPSDSLAYDVRIAFREGNNAFSIADVAQGPHLLLLKGQLHVSLRNDFASRHTPLPWRISSNWGGNLLYGFYTDTFPRKREYAFHTNRPQDFTPPLNQAELTLTETENPAILRVDADTYTPCFESFVVRIDGGEWYVVDGSSFDWPLHEGLNTLRVRTRNTAGVMGVESLARVVVNR